MNLLIVESPSKIKTIQKYLKTIAPALGLGEFKVLASYGHVRDLAKEDMGVDVEHGFSPVYVVIADKEKRLKELRDASKEAKCVWLATDLDREGEAISWHIKDALKLAASKTKRVTFNEITSAALEKAMRNPRAIDMAMVDAQQARRVLDRLIGFKLTQLLWKTFTSSTTLSAGRVQSAVLDILVAKEDEIAAFTTGAYWQVHGDFVVGATRMRLENAHLYSAEGGAMTRFEDEAGVKAFLKGLSGKPQFLDAKLAKHTVKPELPYTTSSMQQDAHGKLGMSIARSMKVAQELYEHGLITYMRTDSHHLSEECVGAVRAWIEAQLGTEYLGDGTQKKAQPGAAAAQEAHEAIRPTDVGTRELVLKTGITADHQKLYGLIWRRTVESQMAAAVYYDTVIRVSLSGHLFKGSIRSCVFDGFTAGGGEAATAMTTHAALKQAIAALDAATPVALEAIHAPNTWSVPPARYNESAIVRTMEKDGIGRPSTYASILAKLYEKQYVEVRTIEGPAVTYRHYTCSAGFKVTCKEETKAWYSERSKIVPTPTGKDVASFLRTAFPLVVSKAFSAKMEASLDKIAEGDATYESTMREAYGAFMESYDRVVLPKRGEKAAVQSTNKVIVVDGVEYGVRVARYGPVIELPESKFINLKPYLKMRRMALEEVGAADVALLTGLPRRIGTIARKAVQLHYGPYGFYTQHAEVNRKVYPQWVDAIMEGETDGLVDAVKLAIEKKA